MQLLIGFGGNLADPPQAFRAALETLAEVHDVLRVSWLYRSAPQGPPQPRYWNMAALIEACSPLLELLESCQHLEDRAGRDRRLEQRWGPRPLDIDLLMAPDVVHHGGRLELPHPRLHARAFALVPAAELAPDMRHPFLGTSLADLACTAADEDRSVRRVRKLM